jgi:hypothetical protein
MSGTKGPAAPPAPPANFDPAHRFFSQALVALANPYSSVFTEVRDSAVGSIQTLRQITAESPVDRLKQSRERLPATIAALKQLNASVETIMACRTAIQGFLNEAPTAAHETHAEIFRDDTGQDSDKGDWEQVGSDEEVIG